MKTSRAQWSLAIPTTESDVLLAVEKVVECDVVGDNGGEVTQGGILVSRELVGEPGSLARSYERF